MLILKNSNEIARELGKIKLLPADTMNTQGYKNLSYWCGCERFHGVNDSDVTVAACVLPVQFVFACESHFTFVKMKGIFKISTESIWTYARNISAD